MSETVQKIKASDHESYNSLTLISFLLPGVGFILGIVYLTKDKAIDRKLGEHLIAFSILICILAGFIWVGYVVLVPHAVPADITTYTPY